MRIATHHGAQTMRVFGSAARGEAGPGSDVDVLVDMGDRQSLFALAALPGDLEELLGCPVHVMTTGSLTHAREHTREQIERETVSL
jgi:predicted nucleotidyltransferase